MSKFRGAARAAQQIALAVGMLMLVSIGIAQISFLGLYSERFAFEPGPWFSEHIAPAMDGPNHCVILGASTAREGFDTATLESSVPGVKFLNAATTAGNIELVEVQARILARYGVRPRCVIVGVHPLLMTVSYPLVIVSTGYLAHLGIPDAFLLSDLSFLRREFTQVFRSTVLPLKLHADRLNKLVRYKVFQLQQRFRSKSLPITAYQHFDDEFKSGANAYYDDVHAAPERVAELIKMRYETYDYTSQLPVASFRKALTMLRKEAGTVFVVALPNQNALEGLNAKGQAKYDEAIKSADIIRIDCSRLVADEHFIDDIHLDKNGRRILSNAIGKILTSAMSSSAKTFSCSE